MAKFTVTIDIPDDLELESFTDDPVQILRDAVGEFAAGRRPVEQYVRNRYAKPGTKPANLAYGEYGSETFNKKVAQVERRVRIAEFMRFSSDRATAKGLLVRGIEQAIKQYAGKDFILKLEAGVRADPDGETIERLVNVMVRAVPIEKAVEGQRETEPPPEHAMSSDPVHPHGCYCAKCA